MKLTHTLIFMALISVAAVSCSDKKQTGNIIAHKPVKKAPSAPVKMQNSDFEDAVSWIGSSYKVKINRKSDPGLSMIVDDSGNKYYDNVIEVSVIRPDGTEFFKRKFTKSDFLRMLMMIMPRRAHCSVLYSKRSRATTLSLRPAWALPMCSATTMCRSS